MPSVSNYWAWLEREIRLHFFFSDRWKHLNELSMSVCSNYDGGVAFPKTMEIWSFSVQAWLSSFLMDAFFSPSYPLPSDTDVYLHLPSQNWNALLSSTKLFLDRGITPSCNQNIKQSSIRPPTPTPRSLGLAVTLVNTFDVCLCTS